MRYRHLCVLALVAALVQATVAQTKAPVAPADYGKWETLVAQPRGGLSPDGRWLAYGMNRTNRSNELRIVNVENGTLRTAPFGSQPAFSADSRWAALPNPARSSNSMRLQHCLQAIATVRTSPGSPPLWLVPMLQVQFVVVR